MWYFSLHFGRKQRIAAGAIGIAVLLVVVGKISSQTSVFHARTIPAAVQITNTNAADMTERTAFLAKLGFSVQEEVMDTVTIPKPFDAVFEEYNALQQAQGFDLQRYRGKEVQRYRYPVVCAQGEGIATLFVYHDKIIGGDFSTGGERYALGAAAPDS